MALKHLGFSLTQIAEILEGKLANIASFLEFQEIVAQRELAQAQRRA